MKHSPPKNGLTTKPYHLLMRRHHREPGVVVDDNGAAPRRPMDDNPPHPPDSARERDANTTGQGTAELHPICRGASNTPQPYLKDRQQCLLATRSCCTNLQEELLEENHHHYQSTRLRSIIDSLTSHLSLAIKDRWIRREIPKTSTPNRERGFCHQPPPTNAGRNAGDPEHHNWSTIAHLCYQIWPDLSDPPNLALIATPHHCFRTLTTGQPHQEDNETTTVSISAELKRGRRRRDRGGEGKREEEERQPAAAGAVRPPEATTG
ncbi:hypothetical protein HID58_081125 [Brassica napus]|uniref:Uncharacterized protein n=1 Tax=Brassica napus TaxID=3708 RepID=A0ABQ7Y6V6_BRANA|nr:hypothetical protein HID58_081125 [Brassica napus]